MQYIIVSFIVLGIFVVTTMMLCGIHVTDVMSKAGELLGIPLYDHIIAAAGSDEIYSFYEKGSMPQSQLKYADRVADINLRSDMAETNEIRKPLKLHQIKI